jgi:hypothetical protein
MCLFALFHSHPSSLNPGRPLHSDAAMALLLIRNQTQAHLAYNCATTEATAQLLRKTVAGKEGTTQSG